MTFVEFCSSFLTAACSGKGSPSIRTRGHLTSARRATNWATPHSNFLKWRTAKKGKPVFGSKAISIRLAECGADYSYNDDDVVIVLDSEEENEYIQASSQHVIFGIKPPPEYINIHLQEEKLRSQVCTPIPVYLYFHGSISNALSRVQEG